MTATEFCRTAGLTWVHPLPLAIAFWRSRIDFSAWETELPLSPQNDNVLFAQSRNVLLTPSRLGRWQKDNY